MTTEQNLCSVFKHAVFLLLGGGGAGAGRGATNTISHRFILENTSLCVKIRSRYIYLQNFSSSTGMLSYHSPGISQESDT